VKMWSGRFREPLDPAFEDWQRSLRFDWRLLPCEVAASQAHARALEKLGVLSQAECTALCRALDEILTQFSSEASSADPLAALDHPSAHHATAEDVHHFVELELKQRLGDTALKLHTGRSRNEQIATDLRLYVRDAIAALIHDLQAWQRALLAQAEHAGDAVMPAYTHLQRAEPVLVAHWLLAYFEMLTRDISRLRDCAARADRCPLGSGAVAGATLPLDRTAMAADLGFASPTANSMDATSDRDFLLEYLQSLSQIALHASRFAEEITLYATAEFGFLELPERFATGSSAMPQKKNPDLTELTRARAGRILAAAHNAEFVLKGLPLAYNKDLQDLQEPLFTATREAHLLLRQLAPFTQALQLRTDRMRAACDKGFLNAMAAATYLVHKGIPFRTAHEIVGHAVRQGLEAGCELGDLPLATLQALSPAFDQDFFAAVTLQATLDCHDVAGGTARHRVAQALAAARSQVDEQSNAEVSHARA
jgi:argininosuccinate lyase